MALRGTEKTSPEGLRDQESVCYTEVQTGVSRREWSVGLSAPGGQAES